MIKKEYVLITAARNEEAYIEMALKSVLGQSLLPKKWVIVSDASNDRTDEIVQRYAREHEILEFARISGGEGRLNYARKVFAIRKGIERINHLGYSMIGNLDADISLDNHYFENLCQKFADNPKLGIGGGFIHERRNGTFRERLGNCVEYVPGGVQLFRRECFEAIGGYVPVSVGGEDTIAVIGAKMKGWEVRGFPELIVFHHKKGSEVRGVFRETFRNGAMNYALGSHPLFYFARSFWRVRERRYPLSAFGMLAGFIFQRYRKKERPVPKEFVAYLRKDQLRKIRYYLNYLMPGKTSWND